MAMKTHAPRRAVTARTAPPPQRRQPTTAELIEQATTALTLAERNIAGSVGSTAQGNTSWPLYGNGADSQNGNLPIPKMDAVSPEKPPLWDLGATGTSFFGSLIQNDEYNPEFFWRDAILKWEEMRRNDAQVRAMEALMVEPLIAANWYIKPASEAPMDQEIAAFVESCLFHDLRHVSELGTTITQPWPDLLRHVLLMLPFGFMPFEICYRVEDGWVKWSRFQPLLPRTVWRWWVGPDNELEGVQQWSYKAYTYHFANIPREKLLLFSHRMEGQNYEGISIFRSAFKHWWYKQVFEKIAAIAVERTGIVPPVINLGANPTAADVSAALKIVANVRANEQMGVVIPNDWRFEFPRLMANHAEGILPLITYHDQLMARNILAPFLNLGSTETGAYSLDASQKLTFYGALQGEANYVCGQFNQEAIPRLVDYNYENVAQYPQLCCAKLVSQDLPTLGSVMQQLAVYIPPSPPVNDYVADLLGIPKPPQNAVVATNPSDPQQPGRPQNARQDDHDTSDATSGLGGGRAEGAGQDDSESNDDAGDAQSAGAVSIGAVSMTESLMEASGELSEELRLLRETFYAVDAVTRGLESAEEVERTVKLFNPYHDARGRFTSGPGGGAAAGGGSRSARGRNNSSASGSSGRSRGQGRQSGSGSRSAGGGSSSSQGSGQGQSASSSPRSRSSRASRATQPTQPTQTAAEREVAEAHAARAAAQQEYHDAGVASGAAYSHRVDTQLALADAKNHAEADLRQQALREASPEDLAHHQDLERQVAAAKAETEAHDKIYQDHLNELSRLGREARAQGINPSEHPEYQALWERFAAHNEEADRAYSGRSVLENALKDSETRIVGDRASPENVAKHPDVIKAMAAHQAASADAAAANQRMHAAVLAVQASEARVTRAEGLLDVERGGTGIKVNADSADRASIRQVFGRDLSDHELAQLAGADIGSELTISGSGRQIDVALNGATVSRDFQVERRGNQIVLHDNYTRNTGERTSSSGQDLIRGMQNMRALGVTKVECLAARNSGMNGYYTWAKLGFTGKIPGSVRSAARAQFGNVTRVEQIMQRPGGAAWWKQNGDSFDASFSFRNGYSMNTLNRFLARIGGQNS